MELSQAKQKEAKKLGTTVQSMLMADLVSIGYSEQDAYVIAYPENIALSATQNKTIRENISASQKFQTLLTQRAEKNGLAPQTLQDMDLMDKEQTARLIMQSAMKQPADSKERIEGLMKFSDLMGYKKEDTGDTKDSIMFAFPIKCYQCPLLHAYNEYRKDNGEKELRPVEMDRVIRQADTIIKKATKKESAL